MENRFGKINRLSVSGFRSIRELDVLPLDDINVVIGPNGSGKSNFVGVFRLLNELVNGNLQDYVTKRGGADRILHFGSKTTQRLKIEVLSDENTYEIDLVPTDGGAWRSSERPCHSETGPNQSPNPINLRPSFQ